MSVVKVEDRLKQALASSGQSDELLDVVLRFDMPKAVSTGALVPLKERREGIALLMSQRIQAALERAGEAAGQTPAHVSMFPALGSAMVQARRPYVQALLKQSEVTGAMLNADKPTQAR